MNDIQSKLLLRDASPANLPRTVMHRANMSKRLKGLSSYDQVQEHDVASKTSATELVTMLFDKACVLLKTSMQGLEKGDGEVFHHSSLHALQIVLSLRFVLDTESGSELSQSLFGTYTTIAASLKKARQEQDAAAIATIYEALDELRTAWHSVSPP
jgi:flagellar biosynthetic protein FliS